MPYAYSRPYVYSFWQIFQALRLFPALRLFQTLEYMNFPTFGIIYQSNFDAGWYFSSKHYHWGHARISRSKEVIRDIFGYLKIRSFWFRNSFVSFNSLLTLMITILRWATLIKKSTLKLIENTKHDLILFTHEFDGVALSFKWIRWYLECAFNQ